MKRNILCRALMFCFLAAGSYIPAQAQRPSTDVLQQYLQKNWRSPEQYIVDKFKDHDVILLSEDHAISHNLLMAQAIIPMLYKAGIYDFGVEFGAAEDQATADSLVTAPEYDDNVAKQLLFNYNVGWAFKEYRDLYRAAWQLNKSLSANARKFRIISISYKYNWASCDPKSFGIRTPDNISRVFNQGNTEFFRAALIKKEILDKHEKILVLCGLGHAYTKYNTPYYDYHEENFYRFDSNRMGNILYRDAPNRIFTILLHYPFESKTYSAATLYPPANGAIDDVMKRFTDKRVGFDLEGTPFGQLPDTSQYSIGYKNFKLGDMAGGYIYQMPFDQYVGCTVDSTFFNDANWPLAIRNFPDKDIIPVPANKEAYLEKIRQYVNIKWRYRNLKYVNKHYL